MRRGKAEAVKWFIFWLMCFACWAGAIGDKKFDKLNDTQKFVAFVFAPVTLASVVGDRLLQKPRK